MSTPCPSPRSSSGCFSTAIDVHIVRKSWECRRNLRSGERLSPGISAAALFRVIHTVWSWHLNIMHKGTV